MACAHFSPCRHRHSGKWEAHLWDSEASRAGCSDAGPHGKPRKRGRQVYLGGYGTEVEAAHAYDKAALAYWGKTALLNVSAEGGTGGTCAL